jgi:opacity protein-like surface antigen
MKAKPILAALAATAAFCAVPAEAQDLSYGIKFGGGLALTGNEAQASRAALGFAVTGGWNFAPNSELFIEAGYKYFKADWVDRTRLPNRVGGTTGYTAYPNFLTGEGYGTDGVKGHIFNTNPWVASAGSVDMRKEDLEGWGASAGYRLNLPGTNFYVHGAVMLYVMQYFEEVIGELRVYDALPTNAARNPALLGREGLSFTNGNHSISPGFFAGAQWRLDKNIFFDLNLNWMSYSTIQYQPYVYTGNAATTTTDKDAKVFVDFSFGFRF